MNPILIHIEEQETYPYAEQRFIDSCKFDLTTPKHQRMMDMGRKVREDGLDGINIQALVSFYGPESYHNGEIDADGTILTCNYFHQIPDDVVKGIYIYMLTVGEMYFSSEENIMDFLYADIWGTSYVDAGTDVLILKLQKDMEERFGKEHGLQLTPEFGPGYFGMPVIDTKKFGQVLDSSRIGVRIKESGLMIPQKSISGLFFVLDGDYELKPEPECLQCVGNHRGCEFCVVRARKNKETL